MKRLLVCALFVLMACSDAKATITITAGMTVDFAGDSTSNTDFAFRAWYDTIGASTGLFVANVNAIFTTPTAKRGGVATGNAGVATGSTGVVSATAPGTISPVNSGVNGDVISGLQSQVASRITANAPSVVFIAEGTNDIVAGTTPSAFAASYQSVIDQIHAWNAGTQVACLSIYSRGEVWSTGPVWGVNSPANDAAVDALNTAMAGLSNCTYINTRAPLLTWEVTNNPTKDATGHATVDGVHLTAAGKSQVGASVLSAITVVP